MSQSSTAILSPTARSRLAQIMGLPNSPEPSTSKRDEDWYIPYNGPIEPPRTGRPRGNTFGGPTILDDENLGGNWDAEDDTFGYQGMVGRGGGGGRARATSNATRKSYASTSSAKSQSPRSFFGGGGGGIGEAPVHSAASTRDRASVYSTRDRASTYSTRERSSDEREREHRGSIASFLTFGQGSRKSVQRPSVNVSTAYASSGLLPLSAASRHLPHGLSPVSPHAHGLSPVSPPAMHRNEESAFVFPTTRRRRSEDSASSVQVHVYAMPSHTHTPFQPHPQSQAQHRGRQRSGTIESTQSATARPVALSLTAADRARETKRAGRDEAGVGSSMEMAGEFASGSASTGAGGSRLRGGSSSEQHRPSHGEPRGREEVYNTDHNPGDGEPKEYESEQLTPTRLHTLSHSTSNPVISGVASTPQRHPYAVAFPSAPPDQPPPQLHSFLQSPYPSSPKPSPPQKQLPTPSIVLPSHFSTTTVSTGTQPPRQHTHSHTTPGNTATVSPAAIAAAINTQHAPKLGLARGLLRPVSRAQPQSGLQNSFSTPNLRGLFRMGGQGEKGGQNGAKPAKTQYAAETWCDALMFPRPRFRAHVISPPTSPTDKVDDPKGVLTGRDGAMLQAPNPSREVVLRLTSSDRHVAEEKPALRRAATAAAPRQRSRSPLPLPRPHSPPHTAAVPPPTLLHTPPKQDYFPPIPYTTPRHDYLSNDPHPTPKQPPPLSPAEETLRRVIAEGEQRNKERDAWNEVARSSFQNRRSRSLSRTRSRKRSGPTVRIRVDSEASAARTRGREEKRPEGLGRLTTGLATLAAEAFNQPTPTISTASASHSGATDSNVHSRNTSASIGQGHARNTSWSKVALKKLCAPESDVFSDAAVSPQQEKLEGALMNERTAKMRVRGRREEAEEADVQFMDIGPLPPVNDQRRHLKADSNYARLDVEDGSGRSRSQNSNTSDALDVPAVGIALSTPPLLSPSNPNLPDLSAHPYAQPSAPRLRAGPVPVSASYAGPHPTSSDYNKHRLPPYVQSSKPPELRMYAATQDGAVRQVSTPEISQSPVPSDRNPRVHGYGTAGSPGAYAYGNVTANDKRESTLGVEEVLMSRVFQRGGGGSAEDSGFGSVDDHDSHQSPPPRELTPPPAPASRRLHPKPVALNAFSGIPSLSHTVTTAAATDLPEPELVQRVMQEASLPSPSSMGSVSTQTSPRHMGIADDLEPFRDLFYKPGQPSSENFYRAPSSELRRRLGSRDTSVSYGEERISSGEGLNGLRNMARQLSDELPMFSTESTSREGESRQHTYGQRLGGLQEERLDGHSPSLPGLHDELSLHMGSPLSGEYDETQDFPEDIQSSRASSDIEHESIEETLRLGSVPLAVPQPTQAERRQSTTLSFGETVDDTSLRPSRDTAMTGTSSLGIPATVEALMRTSFATSTSTTSRMSNLIGDFPTPPVAEGVTPPSAATLNSYFVPPEPSPTRSRRRHPSLDHVVSMAEDNS